MLINADNTSFRVAITSASLPLPGLKQAPGKVFDYDRPDGCMGVCLGVCAKGRVCPFLGCKVTASVFEQTPTLATH